MALLQPNQIVQVVNLWQTPCLHFTLWLGNGGLVDFSVDGLHGLDRLVFFSKGDDLAGLRKLNIVVNTPT